MIYLTALFIKHWYVDFCLQTPKMLAHKGIYGNIEGMKHSGQHAFLTLLITALFTMNLPIAIMLAVIDFALHYHIDWIKIKFGEKDNTTKLYWNEFGQDQLAHALTYILLASILL